MGPDTRLIYRHPLRHNSQHERLESEQLQRLTATLAKQNQTRYVEQHGNPTLTIQWDWQTVHLRTGDLIALGDVLEEAVDGIRWDDSHAYILWLEDNPLHFQWHELLCFRDLLRDARAKLSRDFTRWVDIDIRLQTIEQTAAGLHLHCN